MAIKLVVTDMDETFLRADKTYDIEKAAFVFEKLKEKGIIFAVASGNFIPLLEDYFEAKHLEHFYLAGDDGNVLKYSKSILRTLAIDRDNARDLYNYLEKLEGYYPIFSVGDQAYVQGPINEWADREIRIYYKGYQLIQHFDEIPADKDIIKIDILSEHSLPEIKNVMKQIKVDFPDVSAVTSGEEWLDIYHRDGGKGAAVKFIQNKHNISQEETICFGDSLNDLSMMNEAKYSMAMKNADDELKEICNYEIGSNEQQSVLNILEELLTDNNMNFLEEYRR